MSNLFFPSFPPNISLNQLIKPLNRKQKKPTKAPNAFIIYRINYCREILNNGRLSQPRISSMASQAWKLEPQYVKKTYHNFAKQAQEIYLATKNHGRCQPENAYEEVHAATESDALIDNQSENGYDGVQATIENDDLTDNQQNGIVEGIEINPLITGNVEISFNNPYVDINVDSELMNMQNRLVTLENELVSMNTKYENEIISMRQTISELNLKLKQYYTLSGI
ncbi:9947_t:CDS:1 [Ambispora leptoticha]|uniref:9947_t:CDS:1 n=1 Tax=Ambispora leptoticha TaxID=144679 RepID=A0A9N9DH27_9GLOM|nr:9947_t:CDS:1 [Ambispora leptoticha]